MSGSSIRPLRLVEQLRAVIAETGPIPQLVVGASRRPVDRSAIVFGRGRDGAVSVAVKARLEHTEVTGTTGGGKTKLLEHLIRQDIAADCGVMVIDPHGEHPDALYRSVLARIDKDGRHRDRLCLIDPNAGDYTIGFNPLARPDEDTDVSVLVRTTMEAFQSAWGDEDTTNKPTIERVLTTVLGAAVELGLTLFEAPFLLDRRDRHGLRAEAIERVQDRYTKDELIRLHELSLDERRRGDYDIETKGPFNRLARFLRPKAIRAMVGQTDRLLDLRKAMDDGQIVLCSLGSGPRVDAADADLLGRLLLQSVFFHAKRRKNPRRPFFVYLDECHRYLCGDLEQMFAELRKFGVGIIAGHQFQAQLSAHSETMLAAVRNCCNIKIVFRQKDPKEAQELAEAVLPLDLELPVQTLIKPAVVAYRRTRLANESQSEQRSSVDSIAEATGTAHTVQKTYGLQGSEVTTDTWNRTSGTNGGWNRNLTNSQSSGSRQGESLGSSWQAPDALSAPTGAITFTAGSDRATDQSAGRASSSGTNGGWSEQEGAGGSRAVALGWTLGIGIGHSVQEMVTRSHADGLTLGTSRGSNEALEPVLANVPSAVHSKEAMLYKAGELLRNLKTGQAVVSYASTNGLVSAFLQVPRVSGLVLSSLAFAALRRRLCETSPSAIAMSAALQAMDTREQGFLARRLAPAPDDEPVVFRTKAPPIAPSVGRTRSAASGRRRSRRAADSAEG